MNWVLRWAMSTNAKDIAVLYFMLALFSGVLGTVMSLVLRLELSAPGEQILMGNHQLFNVVATAHAVLMVFFLIMPATMGFFGKENNYSSIYNYNHINYSINNNNNNLGSYLAGLIEGDGSIAIYNDITKTKYSPKFYIVFNSKDKYLAEYLCNKLNIGTIIDKSNKGNYVLWSIVKIIDVYKLIKLINGNFRTAKYEALIKAINWLNKYIDINTNKEYDVTNPLMIYNKNKINNILSNINKLPILPRDNSDLNSNGWLSGFTDADGNFSINLSLNSKKHKPRINLSYRLEITQTYKNHNNHIDTIEIMIKISQLFNTGLYSRERIINDNLYGSYIVSVNDLNNLGLVKDYFNKYKLLSSKYLDFKDWEYLLDYKINNNIKSSDPSYVKLGKELRLNYNSTRDKIRWDYLENNYKNYNIIE